MVLVSTLFLTSHAYLKDSSIQIRASSLTGRFHSRSGNGANDDRTAKTAVDSALRQAQVQSGDLQIVEVQQNANRHLREALGNVNIAQPRDPWSSPDILGPTTGWRGLMRLGKSHEG